MLGSGTQGRPLGEEDEVSVSSWAPIVGRWSVEDGRVIYLGPQENASFPFGLCVSNVRLSEGEASVSVSISPKTSGRLLLGYRSPDERYLSVGLAGYGFAYTITDFEPAFGWRGISNAGSEANLQPDRSYRVATTIVGQRLYLTVDQVRVLEHVLERPVAPGQVGLFAWGQGKVVFQEVKVRRSPGKVFVVMQFSEPFKQLHTEVIQPIAKEFGLHAYHAGDVFGPGIILHDIAQGIIEAKIVIAEVTAPNQNVFYELGYAHALGKPTILLAERGKQLPFDIAGYRCLFYENTIGGKKQVEDALRKHFQTILHE